MRTRGFTLLEMMMVVAILGILAGLSYTTMEGGRARTAPRNAAADLSAGISLARARAMERGSDVWLILYPNRGKDLSTAGNGAWFIYDDGDANFGTTGTQQCTGAVGSSCNYETFLPPSKIYAPNGNGVSDFTLESNYFDDAPRKNVKFGNTSDTTVTWGEPFGASNSGLNASSVTKDCSFCTGAGVARRGAIVFNGDGAVRFVDGSGNPVPGAVGGFSIQGVTSVKQVTLFGVASATGYVGVFQ